MAVPLTLPGIRHLRFVGYRLPAIGDSPCAICQALIHLRRIKPLRPHHRPRQSVRVVDVVVAIAAFDAGRHAVDRGIGRGGDADDLVAADVQVKVASHAAVGTGGAHFFDLAEAALADTHLVVERADGAVGDALTAALAARVKQVLIRAGHQLAAEPAVGEVPHIPVLDLGAGTHAAGAQNTLVAVDEDERVRVGVDRICVSLAIMLGPRHIVLVDQVLQLARAVDLALHALVRVIAEQHLQDKAPRVPRVLALRVHDHPLEDGRGAGRLHAARPLDRHDAQPARADVAQVRVVAQRRDADPRAPRRFQDGRAVGCDDALVVDGECNGHRISRTTTQDRNTVAGH